MNDLQSFLTCPEPVPSHMVTVCPCISELKDSYTNQAHILTAEHQTSL